MSNFFYRAWKALWFHSQLWQIRLNLLRIEWVMPLLKLSNVPLWHTFWGHVMTLRDEFYIFWNVLSRATFGSEMTFLSSQAQIACHTRTCTHCDDNIAALRLRRARKNLNIYETVRDRDKDTKIHSYPKSSTSSLGEAAPPSGEKGMTSFSVCKSLINLKRARYNKFYN